MIRFWRACLRLMCSFWDWCRYTYIHFLHMIPPMWLSNAWQKNVMEAGLTVNLIVCNELKLLSEFTNYKSPQASLSALHSLKPKCFLVGWYRQHIRWYGYICNRPISAKRYIGQALILSTWVQYMAFCLCFLFFFPEV